MNAKLFLIALTAFLGVSQFANAGVLMFVHFGNSSVTDISDRQSTVDPNTTQFTANIYLQLEPTTSIYSYRFSVRYDDALLDLDVNLEAPTGVEAFTELQNSVRPKQFKPFAAAFGPAESLSSTQDAFSTMSFKELRNFSGMMDSGSIVGPTLFKVATINFLVDPAATLNPGDNLIIAGKFYATNDISIDGIGSDDQGTHGPIDYPIQAFGGSVSGGGAVPEPASIIVCLSLGLGTLVVRGVKNRLQRPR
ncbi:MAG: hypothetical protein SFV81_26310 [Pirellulaceae bacterium]|nr:hypothetical protein [Pirellulaceae bacterium]